MQITTEEKGNYTLIRPEGKLDSATSPVLEEKILTLINEEKRRLLIDFEKLDYISSAGLRVLLIAAKKSKSINGELRLSSMNSQIKDVFNISGFSSLFKIYNSAVEVDFQ
ncbi:MAG: STAS domain-containing protein [Ignavibacteriaceae bacterium]